MQLIYNNVDITSNVDINTAVIHDRCGGKADSIELIFSDTEKLWREWNPKKGDIVILSKVGFSSGIMYVDEPGIIRGKYILRAKSTPLISKGNKTKSWENIRFKEMAKHLTEELGLEFESYGITDHWYDRLDMLNKTNLQFLNERCILERYSLKITNKKAIVYNERILEQSNPVLDITEDMLIGDYSIFNISEGLYNGCEIEYFSNENKLIKYNFIDSNIIGPVLTANIRAANQSEAERYSKGILRNANKNETIGSFKIKLNTNIAAGNTINLNGFGSFSGKYFIKSISQNLTNGKSLLKVRKILEAY